jgi:phosphoenolpyruvate carboxykinase (ATP)
MENIDLKDIGISHPKHIYRNLEQATLTEIAIKKGEGKLSSTGALTVVTGKYTGRSPDDKFIVDGAKVHDEIAWGKVNRPISKEKFDALYQRVTEYIDSLDEVYVFDGYAGADKKYTMAFRVVNEMACQNLFIRDLLIRPTKEELKTYVPDFVILVAPGFKCVPERDGTHSEAAIIIDYEAHKILIAGTAYSGEIKKSVFSTMNYFMTKRDVMPMHCSANIGKDGDTAIFFGLSGTGKTTLSADPNRQLIGDDEHGWSNDGVFNFEGGCYAKCIDLSKEGEPEIYNAIKFGALVENVVMDDDTRTYDFTNRSLTENTRVGYPIDYIPSAKIPSVGSQPKTVIFLTADAFGVLPPISKLTLNQAMYYFVSGYTSKLAGTERGITTPQATFSTCFGEPFLPLDPSIYARMLSEKVAANNANVFLVNTGWSGGAYGKGSRMKLKYTRAMVTAALNGTLNNVKYVVDDIFGLAIPTSCPDVPSEILIPSSTWKDKKEYEKTARELAKRFQENFKKYTHMSQEVVESGPKVK